MDKLIQPGTSAVVGMIGIVAEVGYLDGSPKGVYHGAITIQSTQADADAKQQFHILYESEGIDFDALVSDLKTRIDAIYAELIVRA